MVVATDQKHGKNIAKGKVLRMNCTECNKAKQDPQTGDCYCQKKGYLVGKQEDCKDAAEKLREHIRERFGRID